MISMIKKIIVLQIINKMLKLILMKIYKLKKFVLELKNPLIFILIYGLNF